MHLKETSDELAKKGFCVWMTHENIFSCFDILARRDDEIFIIKIYKFIEGLTKENAEELKNLAACLSAYLMVLAESSKSGPLSNGVLYSRYDVAVVTYNTFKEILDEEYPILYSTRGNYCAEIERDVFLDVKVKLNLTLNDIAEILNVSKQAVYRYETQCRIPQNIVEKFSEMFGENAIKRVKFLKESHIHPTKKYLCVSDKLSALGFVIWEGTAAFNILAINKEDKNFIVVSNDFRVLSKKVNSVEEIIEIIPGICISISKYKPSRKVGKKAKFIKENDLKSIETKEEFIEIINE